MKPRRNGSAGKKKRAAPASRRARPLVIAAVAAGLAAVAALAVLLWRPAPPDAGLRTIDGQNVLLITIDTLRADAMSSYGGPAATPALDGLAAEGVRFDFAHAHAVMTLPSHASILTGELPFTHGLRDNSGYRLPEEARTAATMLKQAGYATAAFVAAFPLNARFGLNTGFDVYDDHVGGELGLTDLDMPERPATRVVQLARDWIADHAGGTGAPGAEMKETASGGRGAKPWFVWVHVYEPHAPYQPPPPFDRQYADRPYYGEVAAADAALQPLLDEARKSARPTLVVVTSDHGEGLDEHGEVAHGIFAYESTLRVPLIIAEVGSGTPAAPVASGSTKAPAGEISSVSARHIDILPTILDAVGQPMPPGLAGRTLLPREERTAAARPRPTYFEAMSGMLNHGWAPLAGVIVDRDKFIDLPIAERYDLLNDPGERTNLAGRSPERDRVLTDALNALDPPLPGDRIAEDKETRNQLRALGYVSAQAPRKTQYTEADDPKRLIDIDSAIHDAIDAFNEGRTEEAQRIYQRVIARRPRMAFPYRRLALIEWQRGNAPGAVALLREAVARGVTDTRLRAQLGEYLTGIGQTAESIGILEPLANGPASDAEILNALAIAYASAGDTGNARATFERLVTAMPGSSIPFENLGVLALGVGDVAAAQSYFERALAIAPDSSRAYTGLGATALRSGDRRAAYEAWERAVALDSANYEVMYNLGVNLAREGRMTEARPYLNQFLKNAPPAQHADQLKVVAILLQ